jgi:hypothetical protein
MLMHMFPQPCMTHVHVASSCCRPMSSVPGNRWPSAPDIRHHRRGTLPRYPRGRAPCFALVFVCFCEEHTQPAVSAVTRHPSPAGVALPQPARPACEPWCGTDAGKGFQSLGGAAQGMTTERRTVSRRQARSCDSKAPSWSDFRMRNNGPCSDDAGRVHESGKRGGINASRQLGGGAGSARTRGRRTATARQGGGRKEHHPSREREASNNSGQLGQAGQPRRRRQTGLMCSSPLHDGVL